MADSSSVSLTETSTAAEAQAGRNLFLEFALRERSFLLLLGIVFFVAGATYDTPQVAMWVGFAIAGYSAVANDSIQTLGTFIASNRKTPWWLMWLFVAGIFVLTVGYSWITYNGDVSHQRLLAKGFETAPISFQFLHIAAPIFLLILTRMRMPVSTTFLLLSCFATTGEGILAITLKSVSGYAIAFVVAAGIWLSLGPVMKRRFVGTAHPMWRVAQWASTGFLWSVWLMQDAANIAVYLPRSLGGGQFLAFAGVVVLGLGFLLWKGGERIQEVVDEKADVVDVRAATTIDFIYAVILYIFKDLSNVPMSTTWVFVGLLAGRELAMALRNTGKDPRSLRFAARLVFKDLFYVTVGFTVALVIAAAINPVVRDALFGAS